jgi:hypothetical protein
MQAFAVLILSGLAVTMAGWLWLVVRAFQQDLRWGLCSLVVPPFGLLFALRHAQRAVAPLLLLLVGLVAVAFPAIYLLVLVDPGLHQGLSESAGFLPNLGKMLQSDTAHDLMVARAFYMQVVGVNVAVLAWIWLIVRAFRTRRGWGFASLVFPPADLAFAARHPRKGIPPLTLLLLSLLVASIPALYTHYVPLDLKPRDKLVEGQRHLTLTGSDRKDYSNLKLNPDVVVLQMANSDVTDETIQVLRGMNALQELDLNGTQLTDAGLNVLKDLPALSDLRLARTRITDQGFRDALFSKSSLMKLDLRETRVSPETVQAWRDAKPGRHALR